MCSTQTKLVNGSRCGRISGTRWLAQRETMTEALAEHVDNLG